MIEKECVIFEKDIETFDNIKIAEFFNSQFYEIKIN
jgi:hypothetical protein